MVTLVGGGSLQGAGVATYTPGGGPAATNTFQFTPDNGTTATMFTFVANGTTPVGPDQVEAGTTAAASYQNLAAAMTAVGIAASASSTGVLTVAGGTITPSVAATTQVNSTTSATASIDLVNAAIAKIGSTLSQLGSATIQLQGLEDYTTQLSDSVTTGLGAMVDANLSAESAQLSSLQTKQSLAIQSLTLANQGPSSLLQLFR